jgi:TRAP-type C4-dicarboxylate transport system permease small subunit
MSVGEEVEVETKQFQITQDIIYWAIAIASGLILVTLGIVDVIATSQGSDFITILDINDFVILAIIVVIGIPTFLIVLREERRQTRIDENLPYLLIFFERLVMHNEQV